MKNIWMQPLVKRVDGRIEIKPLVFDAKKSLEDKVHDKIMKYATTTKAATLPTTGSADWQSSKAHGESSEATAAHARAVAGDAHMNAATSGRVGYGNLGRVAFNHKEGRLEGTRVKRTSAKATT